MPLVTLEVSMRKSMSARSRLVSSRKAPMVGSSPRPGRYRNRPSRSYDFVSLDVYEVRVMLQWGPGLRAAIELVSPANKDQVSHRRLSPSNVRDTCSRVLP